MKVASLYCSTVSGKRTVLLTEKRQSLIDDFSHAAARSSCASDGLFKLMIL